MSETRRAARRWGITPAGLAALDAHTTGVEPRTTRIPYGLTDAGLAALDAWPANRIDTEPYRGPFTRSAERAALLDEENMTTANALLCASCDQEITVDEVAVSRPDGFTHETCEEGPTHV